MESPRQSADAPELAAAALTPMMRQYAEVKAAHPDKIILFRLGDFYEMFGRDAETVAPLLGLVLTSREKGEHALPMAGVPHHALETYLARLLAAGFRAVICDQVEDPRLAKGLVRREVTRIVTPGTVLEEPLLAAKANNYLAAVYPRDGRAGLACVDLSTGEFVLGEFPFAELADEFARRPIAECLMPESVVREERAPPYGQPRRRQPGAEPGRAGAPGETTGAAAGAAAAAPDPSGAPPRPTPYPDWAFDEATARAKLLDHFHVATLAGFGCEELPLAQAAAGAILQYLSETQPTSALAHLARLVPLIAGEHLELDATTIRALELLESSSRREREGSLLSVLDRTVTPLGGRLLRHWLARPLATREPLELRHAAVGELASGATLRARLRTELAGVRDLERIAARVATLRATPRDLAGLGETLSRVPALRLALSSVEARHLGALLGRLEPQEELAAKLAATLAPDAPASVEGGGVIAGGVDAELDRLREVASGGRQWIAELEAAERKRTGIASLKVGYNRVFGYYIEVTRTHLAKVPAEYSRKQTLATGERYVTPELKEREAEILGAQERILAREAELFAALVAEVARRLGGLQDLAAALAELDVLASFAESAAISRYVRPEMDESRAIAIVAGRHPVLERSLPAGRFVPNDLSLSPAERILIITGPNMAGKSTYIRQVALLVVMAQAGSFVPAQSARIGLVDRLFARVGAADDLARGQSTFMVEMTETAHILSHATPRSLIILDEIGRGTSTYDGVALAWAVTEHLHENPAVAARTLFATHYHELCELAAVLPEVRNYNVAVREWRGEITFLYRVEPGGTDRSWGIHVARLAGIPEAVIARAREILAALEEREEEVEALISARGGAAEGQLPLFAKQMRRGKKGADKPGAPPGALPPTPTPSSSPPEPLRAELAALDLDRLTPLEALLKLRELQERARREP